MFGIQIYIYINTVFFKKKRYSIYEYKWTILADWAMLAMYSGHPILPRHNSSKRPSGTAGMKCKDQQMMQRCSLSWPSDRGKQLVSPMCPAVSNVASLKIPKLNAGFDRWSSMLENVHCLIAGTTLTNTPRWFTWGAWLSNTAMPNPPLPTIFWLEASIYTYGEFPNQT